MRRPLLAACLLVLPLAAIACKQLTSGAREDFAARYSCPEDRVEVKSRADLQPAQVLHRSSDAPAEPPDEVRRDPGRYARWQKDQADRREARAATYIGYEVIEASGCGHTDLLVCHHPGGSKGGTRTGDVTCERGKAP
jgi:hypothetical protein